MRTFLIGWIAALAALAVLDALWLGVVARDLYRDKMGTLLTDQPRWTAAILFYLVHTAGVVAFPLALSQSWLGALLYGALFGFVVYAAYDLTNLATLRGWPLSLTVIDLAWGTAVTAVSCVAAFLAVRATS
ncbi:MAG: DUF2177 family protein [Proteobacteria bacterium]|nr:DUF2177 family protein [Pseudomonadota bacterium]